MAVQENTNVSTDFAKAQSIDFVNQFTDGIKKLQEMLGITRRQALSEGSTIKTYKSKVTLADGNVAEGDLVPLSKVEKIPDKTYELAFRKYRRAVTLEAIQRSGFDQAVQEADSALLRRIQSNIRTDFASFLATGTGTAAGKTLQAVVADAWGQLQVLFENDNAGAVVVLANPMDVSAYLGGSGITTQNAFGMTYFKAFLDVGMMANASVPKGKIYATVADNINLAYPKVSGGEISKAFSFTTDETGLVGITHAPDYSRSSYETHIITGPTLFAERLDGVVVGTISAE